MPAAVVLLFLLLGHTLAVAPGDEDTACGVPDYPANIRVLLDSWRYQTLLDQSADPNENPEVWTTSTIGDDGANTVSSKEIL